LPRPAICPVDRKKMDEISLQRLMDKRLELFI
jgi:hypothetical protein